MSLALSYGVAFSYALLGKARPTKNVVAYVYEIEVGGRVSTRASLANPVKEVAEAAPAPTAAINYQHGGDPYFILGVANPNTMWRGAQRPIKQPPGSAPTPKTPTLTIELETLTRALRDAEILAEGELPASGIQAWKCGVVDYLEAVHWSDHKQTQMRRPQRRGFQERGRDAILGS